MLSSFTVAAHRDAQQFFWFCCILIVLFFSMSADMATITEEARSAAAAAGIVLASGTVVYQKRAREYDGCPGEPIGTAKRGERYVIQSAEVHTIDSITYVACRVKSALIQDLDVFINVQSVHGRRLAQDVPALMEVRTPS